MKLYGKIIAVYSGHRAEYTVGAKCGDINAKIGGIYSYCSVSTVKCSVQGCAMSQTVSSLSITASECEQVLEEVTL